jgi:hypothetical protein
VLAEVVGKLLVGVAVVQGLVEVGGVGQKRGFGFPVVAERDDAVVYGLVKVAVPGSDDAEVDVGHGGVHRGVG